MKRLFFTTLLIIFVANVLVAQTENYKTAINHFQESYNSEKFDEIFNSFSPEMQHTLPLDKTRQMLASLKSQVGKIESKEFIGYKQGSYAMYKTVFEKAIFAVTISLNEKNKISGLFLKPYEESNKTENKTVNGLSKFPKEIAEAIYSKSRDFPNNTQLSIAIIENGDVNYYGIIKENDTIKPIDNNQKVFEIGSITKVFTSTVLASLVLDNKLKLTDYVNSYFPFTFKNNIKISFVSLANHTSGLPRLPQNIDLSNELNPYKNYGKSLLNEYLENIMVLENEPLKTYSYSNLGAGLLGYTLGLSQKTSFQKLLQAKVFDKYEMANSFTNSKSLDKQLVKGLNAKGEIVPNWDFDVLFGAGGILSTTEDLAKFIKAQFNPQNKELSLTRKPTFVVNDKMKIGLGWHLLKSENGSELFWHNGGTGGYSSSIVVDITGKTAVIILSNVSTFNPQMKQIDKLAFVLINKTDKE